MPHVYDYPRPCVSCDTVVFDSFDEEGIPYVLLVLRKNSPFKGMWALPGGFLEEDEGLEECAARELYEETGVDVKPDELQQVMTVGNKNRDPRTRIISVVYTVVVDKSYHPTFASDDAEVVTWFRMDALPSLAADHLDIIRKTLGVIQNDRS
jgi:8-oxo-dGTP diphosphatase